MRSLQLLLLTADFGAQERPFFVGRFSVALGTKPTALEAK
jgi:hypothetical protein